MSASTNGAVFWRGVMAGVAIATSMAGALVAARHWRSRRDVQGTSFVNLDEDKASLWRAAESLWFNEDVCEVALTIDPLDGAVPGSSRGPAS